MKFFVPAQPDEAKAEELYEAIKKFAKETMGWEITGRRIFRLTFNDRGKACQAEVGKQHPITGETVTILESNAYLVCTPNRGVLRDMPILVGNHEASSAEDFEK